MKGREDPVYNYMRSIPKQVKTISTTPIMKDGRCVGSRISYWLNGAQVVKEILRSENN